MFRPFFRLLSLFLLVLAPGVLRAHDAGLSSADARLTADTLEVIVAYDLNDVRRMLPSSAILGTDSSDHTIVNAQTELQQLATLLVEVRAGETALAARDTVIEFTPGDHLGFRYTYARPADGTIAFRFPNLGALSSTHREVFTFRDEAGAVRLTRLLSAETPSIEVARTLTVPIPVTPAPVAAAVSAAAPAPTPPSATAEPPTVGFRAFLVLGVEHIWTGYDHLLFLFGLLLVCASFRSIVAIITCFTVGHSVTLVLATFDVVNISPAIVEPLIAASIVFVGVENLLRRGQAPRGRPALTLAFGLIHGFGFASVLRDLGVGSDGRGYAMPLFSFNLGVELGQLAVAAIVLPIVWRLRKNPVFLRRGVPVLSALIAAAGFWWLIERTLLST
jgi:hydrogenase/urease accessory protein HupE